MKEKDYRADAVYRLNYLLRKLQMQAMPEKQTLGILTEMKVLRNFFQIKQPPESKSSENGYLELFQITLPMIVN